MSATERSIPAGFAMPCPAICGAEPCTGSKRPGTGVAERCGAREPEAAGDGRRDVGEDVAERVLGQDDVDRLRRVHDRHRERVDERVVERHVRVLGRPSSVTTSRQSREVWRTLTLSTEVRRPPRSRAISNARRAMRSTSVARVLARVEPRAVVARALLAEVEAADELAHDHEVDPGLPRPCGPEVRVDAELLAEAEETLLRSYRLALQLGQPDRAEQDRVGRPARGKRLVGERRCPGEDRVAAERMLASARSRARRARGSPRR